MAAFSKIAQKGVEEALGALPGVVDKISRLPENIFDLPSFKEAVSAFKRSLMGDEGGLSVAEKAAIPQPEVDAEDVLRYGFEDEKDIFRSNRKPFDDWAAGKIDLQDFQKINSPTSAQVKYGASGDPAYPFDRAYPSLPPTSGTEFLSGANYPLDPRSYVLRDLEVNYGLSKPEIMDYFKKNDLLEDTGLENFDPSLETKLLKDAFQSGDPNNPVVKKIRDALADLDDPNDLIPVDSIIRLEDIYGKSN